MPVIDLSPLEIQFLEALALILIACLTVPVFKRIGLGAILGYLAAGVIVGATLSLGFTKNPDKLLHFAEFGVVLFLFVIGLEMKSAKLLEMRGDIFGIGLAQVVQCGGVLAVPPLALGMSYAMGAFIAGVMLADSSFRHELEANVEPFRGLFLGLFFMAVGVSLSIDAVVANWGTILIAVPVVIILKAAVIYGILRGFGTAHEVAVRAALALPQAGEFGFVLFASAVSAGILEAETSSILVAVKSSALQVPKTPTSSWSVSMMQLLPKTSLTWCRASSRRRNYWFVPMTGRRR